MLMDIGMVNSDKSITTNQKRNEPMNNKHDHFKHALEVQKVVHHHEPDWMQFFISSLIKHNPYCNSKLMMANDQV